MAVVPMPKKVMDESEREARYAALTMSLNMTRGFIDQDGTFYSKDDAVEIVNDAKLFFAFLTASGNHTDG
jgi:hypothetical protein